MQYQGMQRDLNKKWAGQTLYNSVVADEFRNDFWAFAITEAKSYCRDEIQCQQLVQRMTEEFKREYAQKPLPKDVYSEVIVRLGLIYGRGSGSSDAARNSFGGERERFSGSSASGAYTYSNRTTGTYGTQDRNNTYGSRPAGYDPMGSSGNGRTWGANPYPGYSSYGQTVQTDRSGYGVPQSNYTDYRSAYGRPSGQNSYRGSDPVWGRGERVPPYSGGQPFASNPVPPAPGYSSYSGREPFVSGYGPVSEPKPPVSAQSVNTEPTKAVPGPVNQEVPEKKPDEAEKPKETFKAETAAEKPVATGSTVVPATASQAQPYVVYGQQVPVQTGAPVSQTVMPVTMPYGQIPVQTIPVQPIMQIPVQPVIQASVQASAPAQAPAPKPAVNTAGVQDLLGINDADSPEAQAMIAQAAQLIQAYKAVTKGTSEDDEEELEAQAETPESEEADPSKASSWRPPKLALPKIQKPKQKEKEKPAKAAPAKAKSEPKAKPASAPAKKEQEPEEGKSSTFSIINTVLVVLTIASVSFLIWETGLIQRFL
ncbi:MAG: hypothetical protein IJ242_00465 [Clostridia bacterium]|nr:hypothetical protein [Clostridia bacterium]